MAAINRLYKSHITSIVSNDIVCFYYRLMDVLTDVLFLLSDGEEFVNSFVGFVFLLFRGQFCIVSLKLD